MRTVTVKQLASELNVEYADAAGLMRIMVAQNAAKVVGTQRNTTATGRACKPSTVYEVPNSFTIVRTETSTLPLNDPNFNGFDIDTEYVGGLQDLEDALNEHGLELVVIKFPNSRVLRFRIEKKESK